MLNCHKVVLQSCTNSCLFSAGTVQHFLLQNATLLMQVQESDMHRVAVATGAQTQTTVNNLNPKVLGMVEAFEEKQVMAQTSNLLWHCIAQLAALY